VRKIGYLAVDRGPQLTLGALALRLQGAWLKSAETDPPLGAEILRAEGIELLVCGTSDSPRGRAIEGSARVAANALGIPVVVIEDFPGNFSDLPGGTPRLLSVESDFAARLARIKAAAGALPVHVGPCIRYDVLRRRVDELRSLLHGKPDNCVLWIGQPETEDALRTLEVLLPALRAQRSALWFRAHPGDEGYLGGAYRRLLAAAGLAVEDLTASSLEGCLRRRPRLVVTQFSSVAVEAGFWGFPALNVLLPEAGAARLAEKKGYSIPPWCDAGAAFVAGSPAEVAEKLERGLKSEEARGEVQQAFDRYFMVRQEGTPALVNLLYNQDFL